MVVEEGELRLVGAVEEARVVLPAHAEDGDELVAGTDGIGGVGDFGEDVALAAEGPDDVAVDAGDEVDGMGVPDGDEVVAVLGLWLKSCELGLMHSSGARGEV